MIEGMGCRVVSAGKETLVGRGYGPSPSVFLQVGTTEENRGPWVENRACLFPVNSPHKGPCRRGTERPNSRDREGSERVGVLNDVSMGSDVTSTL